MPCGDCRAQRNAATPRDRTSSAKASTYIRGSLDGCIHARLRARRGHPACLSVRAAAVAADAHLRRWPAAHALKKTGSRWRKLPSGKIALIVLATLRHDHRLADMAGGNGVSASTIHRRAWEIIGLPAPEPPSPRSGNQARSVRCGEAR